METAWYNAEVLDLGGRMPHPPARHAGRCLIVVVPAYSFLVSMPVPQQDPLNVFERLVLALVQAGVGDAEAIHATSLLPVRFADRLLRELEQRDLIDASGALSERGRTALSGGPPGEPPMYDHQYVIRDELTGTCLPGALTQETYSALAEAGDDAFRWRSRDSRTRSVHTLKPILGEQLPPPTPEEIRAFLPRAVSEEPIEYVDTWPTPCKLLITVHFPPGAVDSDDWYVRPPSEGVQAVPVLWAGGLHDVLAEASKYHSPFHSALAAFTNDLMDDPHDLGAYERAARDVRSRLGPSVASIASLHRYLIGMQKGLYGAEALEARGVLSSGNVQWELLDVLEPASIYAGRALEASLKALQDGHPYEGIPAPSRSSDKQDDFNDNKALLTQALTELGFHHHPGGGAPNALVAACRGLNVGHLPGGRPTLRALLSMAVLQATREERHPLRLAAQRHPRLIVQVDEVAARRNPAAHDADEEARALTLDELRDDADVVYCLAEIALNLS